jgi:Amt family ammonium transporter
MRDICYPLGPSITGTAAAEGRGVIWNDYASHPHRDPKLLQHVSLAACMAAPLKIREQLIGVLTLNLDEPGRYFSQADLALLDTFASQMSVAIENNRLYEEKRLAAIQLEATVEDRTQELLAANQKLQAASRHKSEFLANMSHELRTPLNAVIGFSDLLLGQSPGPLTDKQVRHLAHIGSGGKHLLQLINDILDLSKVEAGKISLECKSLAVETALDDILVIAKGLAHRKGQTIVTEIEPNLPTLRADPVRFKQILLNLLSNAVKFSPDEGLITLSARQGPAADSRSLTTDPSLEIRVKDTGLGVKAEDIPRLFQEFTQLEAAGSKRREGTGLGLALTKKLVEIHGGRIWAESPGEGQGTTFTVLLPFAGPIDKEAM